MLVGGGAAKADPQLLLGGLLGPMCVCVEGGGEEGRWGESISKVQLSLGKIFAPPDLREPTKTACF